MYLVVYNLGGRGRGEFFKMLVIFIRFLLKKCSFIYHNLKTFPKFSNPTSISFTCGEKMSLILLTVQALWENVVFFVLFL